MKNRSKPSNPGREKNTRLVVKQPDQLLKFVLGALPKEGRNSVKAMLSHEQLLVNGKAVTQYDYPLQEGDTVTVQWTRTPEPFRLFGLKILHEDEDVLVVDKEAGLLSIAANTEEEELTAYRQLTEYVRRDNSRSRIFVVHRLDRDTSGVMVFAKTEAAKETLQTFWRERVEERTYIALVEGTVRKEEGTISSWLKESKTLQMYSSAKPNDGQHAVTHYKLLRSNREFSLLQVRLETGRKNQIRVHMQDIGHPIVGDKKYGSKKNTIGRLGLHALVLAFQHPRTGQTLRFESKLPKEFNRPFREEK